MASVPWWAFVALAAAAYLALHSLALRPHTLVVDPGDVGAALAAFAFDGAIESLQYIVPALCLSVLLARLAHLPAEAAAPHASDSYAAYAGNAMTAWEFERMTAGGLRVLRRRGKRLATAA